jgi:hypothetical protein
MVLVSLQLANMTVWSRVLVENLKVVQLLKKFSTFLRNLKVNRFYKNPLLDPILLIQSASRAVLFKIRFNVILLSTPVLTTTTGIFHSSFVTKILHAFFVYSMRVTCWTHPPWSDRLNNICWKVQIMYVKCKFPSPMRTSEMCFRDL